MGFFRLGHNSGRWDRGVQSKVTEGGGQCGEGDRVHTAESPPLASVPGPLTQEPPELAPGQGTAGEGPRPPSPRSLPHPPPLSSPCPLDPLIASPGSSCARGGPPTPRWQLGSMPRAVLSTSHRGHRLLRVEVAAQQGTTCLGEEARCGAHEAWHLASLGGRGPVSPWVLLAAPPSLLPPPPQLPWTEAVLGGTVGAGRTMPDSLRP